MEKQDSGHWQCQVRLEKREGNDVDREALEGMWH